MPEYRQLNFDLLGLVEKPTEQKRRPGQPARTTASSAVAEDRVSELTSTPRGGRGIVPDSALTAHCRELVMRLGLRSLAQRIQVCWNTRLLTTAGLAHHGSNRVDLNPRLERFQPEEPRRTMLHELAHLVAHHRAGGRRIRPHGTEWQRACAQLGIPGEQRCHNLPLARRAVRRKYAYQCRHCGIVVPRVRKLSRESACYPCCRDHNRGRYSRRFVLDPIPLEHARALAPEYTWA